LAAVKKPTYHIGIAIRTEKNIQSDQGMENDGYAGRRADSEEAPADVAVSGNPENIHHIGTSGRRLEEPAEKHPW
jgi:hypothetical protein